MTTIRLADDRATAVLDLVSHALEDLRHKRGGERLRQDLFLLLGTEDVAAITDVLASAGSLYVADQGEGVIGVGAISPDGRTVLGIYVLADHRRTGVGASLLAAMLARSVAPLDGWALPGDRETKSLFESAGWKARRLTMSAE